MARRASNSERIEKAAAEAEAGETEKKAAKKAAKKTVKKAAKKTAAKKTAKKAAPKKRKPKAPARMKLIWAVGVPGREPFAYYAYKDKETADIVAAEKGEEFRVTKARAPMDVED